MRALFRLVFPVMLLMGITSATHAAQWARTYGGGGSELAHSAQQTTDGGYIVAGHTGSTGGRGLDGWVLKLDAAGGIEWQRAYGDALFQEARAVALAKDGGYVIAGDTSFFGGAGGDAWVLKVDAGGSIVWQRRYGGAGEERFHALQPTVDGGYVVAGSTRSVGQGGADAWVVKIDSAGEVTWQKTYGGRNFDVVYSVHPAIGGGFVVGGTTSSFGGQDAWVFKLSDNGTVTWQKTYRLRDNNVILSIHPTADGGYVAAGWTGLSGIAFTDAWVLRLDGSGNVIWQKTYGDTSGDVANSVQPSQDGGVVVVGETLSSVGAGGDAWVLRLDAVGNIVSQHAFGGVESDSARSVALTADGGYVIAGATMSLGAGNIDALVIKVDSNGTIAGCQHMRASAASVMTDVVTTGSSGAVETPSNVGTIPETFSVRESYGLSGQHCYFSAPVAAEVPAMSDWASILIASLVGLSGMALVRFANDGRGLRR